LVVSQNLTFVLPNRQPLSANHSHRGRQLSAIAASVT
jgi:hypothetical protein